MCSAKPYPGWSASIATISRSRLTFASTLAAAMQAAAASPPTLHADGIHDDTPAIKAALVMLTLLIGHIYMGTAALEATFEVMQTGYCDSNWAKEHHDLWYEKVKDSAEPVPSEQDARQPAAKPQPADSA